MALVAAVAASASLVLGGTSAASASPADSAPPASPSSAATAPADPTDAPAPSEPVAPADTPAPSSAPSPDSETSPSPAPSLVGPTDVSPFSTQSDEWGTISGLVTTTNGTPISGAQIEVPGAPFRAVFTDASGKYTASVHPGQYTLSASTDTYAKAWYPAARTQSGASSFSVTSDHVTKINMTLELGATISGYVYWGPTDDLGLSSAVYIYTPGGELVDAGGYMNSSGAYSIGPISPGPVIVRLSSDEMIPQYWNGVTDASQATVLTLAPGQTVTDITAHLHKGGRISGSITDADGYGPGGDAKIRLYRKTAGDPVLVQESLIDSPGYLFNSLAPGDYLVEFDGNGNYESTWWEDSTSPSTATPITITADEDFTADFSIVPVSVISGKVAGADGAPIDTVVNLIPVMDGAAQTTTSQLGGFRFRGVVPGTYTLQFEGTESVSGEWWKDKPTQDQATTFVVEKSTSYPDFNVVLGDLTTMTGTVTSDTEGGALSGITVELYDPEIGVVRNRTTTDALGHYAFDDLAPGASYRVKFDGRQGWADEYWQDAHSLAEARVITVVSGGVSGIDAAMERTGSISGTVTAEDGSALGADAFVEATAIDGRSVSVRAPIDGLGSYRVTGLAPGSYSVSFSGGASTRFATEYWKDSTTLAQSTPVLLGEDSAATGIDAALTKMGRIVGTVTGPDGKGVPGVSVEFFTSSGTLVGSATTSATGAYRSDLLLPGKYVTHYIPPVTSPLVDEWWKDASDRTAASPILLPAANTLTKDVALAYGGQLMGVIQDAVGRPVETGTVQITSTAGAVISTVAISHGQYASSGLAPGTYLVSASSPGLLTTWSGRQLSQATAERITLAAGQKRSYDLAMYAGGTLSGTVTRSGGSVFANTTLKVVSSALAAPRTVYTDSKGRYTAPALPPGTYIVYANSNGRYAGEWWSNQTTQSKANRITVEEGKTTSGIDFTLTGGASVSGVITDPATGRGASGTAVHVTSANGVDVQAITDDSGAYTAQGLPLGTYTVHAAGAGSTVETWLGDTPSAATATSFTIRIMGAVANKSLTLVTGGTFLGRVSVEGEYSPIAGVTVTASNGSWQASAVTASDGSFRFNAVPPGTVTTAVTFDPSNPLQRDLVPIQKVTTAWAGSTDYLPLMTYKGQTLTGTVLDKTGKGIPGGKVFLWWSPDGGHTYVQNGSIPVDWQGRYSVTNLWPGYYKLGFTDDTTSSTWSYNGGVVYKPEYWKDKTSFSTAVRVDLEGDAPVVKNPVLSKK